MGPIYIQEFVLSFTCQTCIFLAVVNAYNHNNICEVKCDSVYYTVKSDCTSSINDVNIRGDDTHTISNNTLRFSNHAPQISLQSNANFHTNLVWVSNGTPNMATHCSFMPFALFFFNFLLILFYSKNDLKLVFNTSF